MLRALMPMRCAAPTETDKDRLIRFVRTKYRIPLDVDLGVADGGPVSNSCFRKLVFASLSGRRFQREFFSSPDFRFLTAELFDAKPDPKAEEEKRRQTADSLVGRHAPSLGRDSAPVTVAVFSDFQCPFCAAMAKSLDALTASDGDQIRVIYHYFPLLSHKWAKPAAEAAACAERQSNALFWSLYEFLFSNQRELSPENLTPRVLAWSRAASGVDQSRFQQCVENSLTSGEIEQDIALGTELGVHATPAVFLNGEPVSVSSVDELRGLVRSAARQR